MRWLEADVADLAPVADGSVDAVAAIDLVEHIDDPTLAAMLRECRRVLKPGGRLGIYTPDRAHYVERMKAHDFLLKQFPQHIAVRRVAEYRRFLAESGFTLELETWSVSPFPLVRWVEKALSPLPARRADLPLPDPDPGRPPVGVRTNPSRPGRTMPPMPSRPDFAPNAEVYDEAYYAAMYRPHWLLRNARKYRERDAALLRAVRPHPGMRLLEVGSARGDTAFFFAPLVAEVVGIDAAETAVAVARRRRRCPGPSERAVRDGRRPGPRPVRRAAPSTPSSSPTSSSTSPTRSSARASPRRFASFVPGARSASTPRTATTGPSGSRPPSRASSSPTTSPSVRRPRSSGSSRTPASSSTSSPSPRAPTRFSAAIDRLFPRAGLCRFRTVLRALSPG